MVEGNSSVAERLYSMQEDARPIFDKLFDGENPQSEMREFLTKYGQWGTAYLSDLQGAPDSSEAYETGIERNRKLELPKGMAVISQYIGDAIMELSFSPKQISTFQDLKNRYQPRQVFSYKDV